MSFKMNLFNSKPSLRKEGNLSKQERLGLTELANNPEIIIKKADKGSAVVVMQTTDYLCEGYRQLSDQDFYIKLREGPTLNISKKIYKVSTKMKNLRLITEKKL